MTILKPLEIKDPHTIEGILSHEFGGNAALDSYAMAQVDVFVLRDDVSDDDRVAALIHVVVKGMGLDPATREECLAHVAALRAERGS